jgi:hypothetical protein
MFQFNLIFQDVGSKEFDVIVYTRGERVIWYSVHCATHGGHCRLVDSGDELPPDQSNTILMMYIFLG